MGERGLGLNPQLNAGGHSYRLVVAQVADAIEDDRHTIEQCLA